jgi:hypothetical protein
MLPICLTPPTLSETPVYVSDAYASFDSAYNETEMRLTFCTVFLLLALQSVAQTRSATSDFSITLERVGCLGSCPDYTVTILADGSVQYEGRDYVQTEGIRKKTIPASEVQKLIEELSDKHFFQWQEKKMVCVDFPEVHITATLKGQHKHVLEGCNSPGQVLSLADDIDRISGAKVWVGKAR